MTNRILFLTTANLSTNPRLLKELSMFSGSHKIAFIGFKLGNWSDGHDARLREKLPTVDFRYIPATRKPFTPWFLSSMAQWCFQRLYSLFPASTMLNAYASNKRSLLLQRALGRTSCGYELIVAHNLGALYPAWWLSQKTGAPFVFDVEDYHPGEGTTEGDTTPESRRREFLMRQLLPKAKCVTFASPLIMKKTLELCGKGKIKKPIVISNCFSQLEFALPSEVSVVGHSLSQPTNHQPLKLVWFSQNINYGRGLEPVIEALKPLPDRVHLTLIGQAHQAFLEEWINPNADFISVNDPMPQADLNVGLSQYDLGLAIELNTADMNRQICLTNKIWAYFQAGLYILATDTPAQVGFMDEHKNHGLVSGQAIPAIRKTIGKIIQDIDVIRSKKAERFEASKQFAWEEESKKIEGVWKACIG